MKAVCSFRVTLGQGSSRRSSVGVFLHFPGAMRDASTPDSTQGRRHCYLRFRRQKGGDWVKVTACQLEAVPAGKKPSSPRACSLSFPVRGAEDVG